MLQDSANVASSGLPILGDLPILGALFRSDNFQRNETELVIVVTPYIVRPVADATKLRLPTDGWQPPSDLERILLLRQTGRPTGGPARRARRRRISRVMPGSSCNDGDARHAEASIALHRAALALAGCDATIRTAGKARGGRTAPTMPICAQWWSRPPTWCGALRARTAMASRPRRRWTATGTTRCGCCPTAARQDRTDRRRIARQPVMPPDVALAELQPEQAPARPDRKDIIAFVTDAETENVLRDGLTDAAPHGVEFHRANVRGAIDLLRETSTPRVLIIDVTGEGRPLTALEELSDVVEPDVQVLLIGEFNDVNFYRHATRILGVKEYLFKPITRDMVARHFGPVILNRSRRPEALQGGRVVTITGVRGGVGASTIAVNLAWHLGKRANRHTVLLDADLYRGSCALLLNAKSGSGLRTALETPQRIDELFIERSAQVVTERLHVLSGEENLLEQVKYEPGAAGRLIETLRRRYNFVVVDAPFTGMDAASRSADAGTPAHPGAGADTGRRSRCAPAAGAAEWAAAGAPRPACSQPAEPARNAHAPAGRRCAEDEGRHRDPRSAEAAWKMPRASANRPR